MPERVGDGTEVCNKEMYQVKLDMQIMLRYMGDNNIDALQVFVV